MQQCAAPLLLLLLATVGGAPIRGVNLGGWLVMEPWITPMLFEMANEGVPRAADGSMQIVDEWTWHNTSLVGTHNRTELLLEHWTSWVMKEHMVAIKDAGITHVRIPVGYWYWNITNSDSFASSRASFPLALNALKTVVNDWCVPLNLSVLLDLHTAPGSQNGFDNSGQRGDIHLLSQPDGGSDTENMLRWKTIVSELANWAVAELDPAALWGIEVMNEPFGAWGKMADAIKVVINPQGYQQVRQAAGDRVNVIFQTGFLGVENQDSYAESAGYKNVWFDDHSYQCFGDYYNAQAVLPGGWDLHLMNSCEDKYKHVAGNIWSFVGEFSLAVTDCAKYLASGINGGCDMASDPSCVYNPTPTRMGHPSTCEYYTRPVAQMPDDYKAFLGKFSRAQMDGFEKSGNGWFFWNFRTENGHAPAWDFLLGVQEGWIEVDVSNRTPFCK